MEVDIPRQPSLRGPRGDARGLGTGTWTVQGGRLRGTDRRRVSGRRRAGRPPSGPRASGLGPRARRRRRVLARGQYRRRGDALTPRQACDGDCGDCGAIQTQPVGARWAGTPVPCRAVPYRPAQCGAVLCRAVPCHAMPCHAPCLRLTASSGRRPRARQSGARCRPAAWPPYSRWQPAGGRRPAPHPWTPALTCTSSPTPTPSSPPLHSPPPVPLVAHIAPCLAGGPRPPRPAPPVPPLSRYPPSPLRLAPSLAIPRPPVPRPPSPLSRVHRHRLSPRPSPPAPPILRNFCRPWPS